MERKYETVAQRFQDEFGIGMCGHISAMLRENGAGDVAFCWANYTGHNDEFGHFFIITTAGETVDHAAFGELEYNEIEILPADEMPDMVTMESLERFKQIYSEVFGA